MIRQLENTTKFIIFRVLALIVMQLSSSLLLERKGKEDSRTTTVAYLFTFETEEMAREFYTDTSEGWTLDIKESGDIDGYSYTIGYCDENQEHKSYEFTTNDESRYGIYLKGKTVFMFINYPAR